jgi:hypothetical protein
MTKTADPYRPRSRKKLLIALPLGAAALALAFGLGQWTADPPPPTPQQEVPVAHAGPPSYAPPPTPAPRPAMVQAPQVFEPVPPPPPPPSTSPTPELVARVLSDATVQLENQRPQILARCSPAGGLNGGAQLTFNVTFDAQGREIARGISENRRARSGAFAKCLRDIDGMRLSIPPPGTNVAVSVPVSFP